MLSFFGVLSSSGITNGAHSVTQLRNLFSFLILRLCLLLFLEILRTPDIPTPLALKTHSTPRLNLSSRRGIVGGFDPRVVAIRSTFSFRFSSSNSDDSESFNAIVSSDNDDRIPSNSGTSSSSSRIDSSIDIVLDSICSMPLCYYVLVVEMLQ